MLLKDIIRYLAVAGVSATAAEHTRRRRIK